MAVLSRRESRLEVYRWRSDREHASPSNTTPDKGATGTAATVVEARQTDPPEPSKGRALAGGSLT